MHRYYKEQIPSPEVVASSRERSETVTRVVTPSVKTVTRLHFGCTNATGAELENSGGPSTAGSHWEKRTLRSEYMTGSSDDGVQTSYSAFTLALLQDSGWYQV